MKITKASDYAMRALLHMSRKPKGTVFMRSELSKLNDVPDSFLGKILQNLAKAGILKSERGKNGGFQLEKNIEDISMFDVIVAIEGDFNITDCLADKTYCNKTSSCKVHKAWCEIQADLINKLTSIHVSDLI